MAFRCHGLVTASVLASKESIGLMMRMSLDADKQLLELVYSIDKRAVPWRLRAGDQLKVERLQRHVGCGGLEMNGFECDG